MQMGWMQCNSWRDLFEPRKNKQTDKQKKLGNNIKRQRKAIHFDNPPDVSKGNCRRSHNKKSIFGAVKELSPLKVDIKSMCTDKVKCSTQNKSFKYCLLF